MTNIFDLTVQHTGWRTGVFATAGWDDFSLAADPGQVIASYYAEVIEGAPLDFGMGIVEDQSHGIGTPIFNVNTSGPLSGPIAPYQTTPSTRLAVYTRDVNPFTVRVVLSDGATTSAPSATYCQYGTRLQPDVGGNIILTSGIITAFLSRFGVAGVILSTLIDTFVGRTLYVGALCGAPPPVMPTFTADDWLTGQPGIPSPQGLGKFWAGMQAAAWPYFCECVPAIGGGPAPTPYPDPVIDVPPSMPIPPAPFECDDNSVCSMLNQILQGQTALAGQISQLRTDVTLIQRQGVPFAYRTGAVHAGLSGDGSFTIADLLGLEVEATTIPGYVGLTAGTPIEHPVLGRINVGYPAGYSDRQLLVDSPQVILPISAAATLVGYSLAGGVVATITELRREP